MSQPMKACPRCGATQPLEAQVCPQCGHQFRTQFPAAPGTQLVGNPPTPDYQTQPGPPPYPMQPYPPQYAAQPMPSTNRVAAGILGILLGSLGIHKFILGLNTAGIIMLCVSLLSCGFAAPIMTVIGLIEGIIYLSKSEQDFYQTYVIGKKQWF